MNTSKHKACFGSIKYSQVLESLSLRGGVRRKAYAPYRIYVIPLRDPALSSSLSTLQHPLCFPFVTLFHITAKTQRPGNYHQLILSPPNFRYTLASVQLFLLGECSSEKNYQWAVLLDAGIYSLLCCQKTLSFEMSYFDIFITSFPLLPQLRFLSLYVVGAHASHLKN